MNASPTAPGPDRAARQRQLVAALSQQFTQLATSAMKDCATDAAKTTGKTVAKTSRQRST